MEHIHFIAQMINAQKSLNEGYSIPTRWLTLRKDLQDKYLIEAENMFEAWKQEELQAKSNRDKIGYQ